ncbi:MAG: polysaccharide biosynthesis tyrosine autokinase [Bacteroidales bacterium]
MEIKIGSLKENDKEQYASMKGHSSRVDVRELVCLFLSKWYLFAISAFVLLAIGAFYLKTRPLIYESKASILVRVQHSSPEEQFLLKGMGNYTTGKSNRDNEIGTIKSLDLATRVVASLELNTTYRRKNSLGLYTPDLYKKSPIYVRAKGVGAEDIPRPVNFIFVKSESGFNVEATYFLQSQKREKLVKIKTLPAYIELEIGKFYVSKGNVHFGSEPLKVSISDVMSVARRYIQNLEVDNSERRSTLLYMVLKTENREKGQDFITALISEYNSDAAIDKNIVAYNSSLFINERIKDVATELGEVDGQVESFRRKYNVADIETQVGFYVRRGETYERRRLELETQLNLVHFIESFIKNPANSKKIVPKLGIKDLSLLELIGEYNTLLVNKERIEASTSTDNPSLKQIKQQVSNLNQNIVLAISNEIKVWELALDNLEKESNITGAKIGNMPTLERQFTNIAREQKIKSSLFVHMLKKREEVNLAQAVIAPKAKIITKPYSGERAVAPRKSLILFLFLLVGLTIPALLLFLIEFFQTKITGMKELEGLVNISVVGDIAQVSDIVGRQSLVVKPNDNSIISEMFRTMRNNLLFMTSERAENIILVTSTIPKEGKTFVSVNLAQSLAQMDKKVLIIGGDLRNPQVGSALGVPKRAVGLSSYLAGLVQDYNEILELVEGNLYTMQSGTIPPNPNELLSNEKFGELLSLVKDEFDYVLVDSAPVGVVSDTFLIAPYAHATIYVVRENYSEKDTIDFINNLAQDQRLKNVGIVLNQTTGKDHSRYKYSHRYKYGYAQEN